ncbi:MAG: hypothetical protein KBT20_05355, partial [Bacteroidales bacterium]|nr:hypothetical protein [Candidatus Liminaster caballi]
MVCDTIATIIISAYLSSAGDHAALYQGEAEYAFTQTSETDHPYWGQSMFLKGDICYDGNVYVSVPIRYNILTNQLAVITPDGKLPVIPHQDKINWFEL